MTAAADISDHLGAATHKVVRVDLRAIGGSALTDSIDVPKEPTPSGDTDAGNIPVTYVPARNLTFFSIAAGYAEVLGARSIYVGVNAVDYSGYPDCRPEFVEAFAAAANLATKAGGDGGRLNIQTPLIDLT